MNTGAGPAIAGNGTSGGARSERVKSRALLSTGVVLTVVLAAAGFALGRNASASRVGSKPGEAWLSMASDGTVNLVDGVSGGSAAKVPVPGATGHGMAVTQQGDLVFVQDSVTGAITVIDTSQLVAGIQVPHSRNTEILAGGGSAYLVDSTAGTVQKVDSTTMAALGAQVKLAGGLGISIVDQNGTLWAPVESDGTVVPVTGSVAGTPIPVATAGADLVMALAGGTPTVVDRTAGALTAVTAAGAEQVIKLPGAADSGDRLQVASVDSNQPLPLLETGSVSQLLLVNVASRVPTSVGLPPQYRGDDLASPIQGGRRTFIPDFTRGAVLVYDNTANRFWNQPIQVLGQGGSFASEVVDGIVYFNDPTGGNAVSVTADGVTHTITKNGRTVPTPAPSSSSSSAGVGAVPSQSSPNPPSSSDAKPSNPPSSSDAKPSNPVSSSPAGPPSGAPTSTQVPVRPSGTTSPAAPPPPPSSSRPKPSKSPTPTPTPTPPPTTSTPPPVAPPAIQSFQLTPGTNSGTVNIQWNNPADSSAIASYQVTVSPNAGKQSPVAGNPTAVDISGLKCGPVYKFAVVSVGKDGLTAASQPQSSRACTAPGAPNKLNVSPKGGSATDITASWSAPTNPGIGSLKYTAAISGNGQNSSQTTTSTSVQFGGLVPGRGYTVQVTASTGGGSASVSGSATAGGSFSMPISLTPVAGYYKLYYTSCVHNGSIASCPTWIQSGPGTWTDGHHGSVVTTVQNGTTLSGYCYGTGYNARADDAKTYSNIWIYVSANGHWGFASSLWFDYAAYQTFGLPECPGTNGAGVPTG